MKVGKITGYWADENHRVLQPPKPSAGTVVVFPGAELNASHTRIYDQAKMPLSLLARCNGIILHDKEVSFRLKILVSYTSWAFRSHAKTLLFLLQRSGPPKLYPKPEVLSHSHSMGLMAKKA